MVTFAFVIVSSLSPLQSAEARELVIAPGEVTGQSFVFADAFSTPAERDAFSVTHFSTAPKVGRPDPGTAKAIAYDQVVARGWGEGEYQCLVALWERESNWNVYATNPSSGAYGIPQSLPAERMASAGADWRTNPATQITWGLDYIGGRYGTPCGAWQHSENVGWY
jgi:hypothetical protein